MSHIVNGVDLGSPLKQFSSSKIAVSAAAPADPQGGPARSAKGRAGFFHFAMQWVHAEPGKIAGLAKSNYIRRVGNQAGERISPARGQVMETSALRTSAYISRRNGQLKVSDELGAYVLIARELPVATGEELARLLDARERTAARTYRCYGGRLPRVASHAILSFRYGVTPEQAADILRGFAIAVSDRLLVPIEAQVHNKDGRPDHAHLILGTRTVQGGVLGRKCRSLDAVSEKVAGHSIDVGGRVVGATIEWMRSEWAYWMREATGDIEIDHRSYDRQGIDLRPVTPVPRADIEYEKRRGTAMWRDRRRRELAARPAAKVTQQGMSDLHHDDFNASCPKISDRALDRHAETPSDLAPTPVRGQKIAPRFRHRAESLLCALVPSTVNVTSVPVDDRTSDQIAELLGLPINGAVFERLLRSRIAGRSRNNAKDERRGEPPLHHIDPNQAPCRPEITTASQNQAAHEPADDLKARAELGYPTAVPPIMNVERRPADSISEVSPLRKGASASVSGTSLIGSALVGEDSCTSSEQQAGRWPSGLNKSNDAEATDRTSRDAHHPKRSPLDPSDVASEPPIDPHRGQRAPDLTHPDLPHAVTTFHALRRAQRLSESRVDAIAKSVQMDQSDFETVAANVAATSTLGQLAVGNILPPHLAGLLRQWMYDDNEARVALRARAKESASALPPEPGKDAPTSQDAAGEGRVSTSKLPRGSGEGRTTLSNGGAAGSARGLGSGQDLLTFAPAAMPLTGSPHVSLGKLPAYKGGPSGAVTAGVLDRAVLAAFRDDILIIAKSQDKTASSSDVEKGVAERLRAAGRDRAAVKAALVTFAAHKDPGNTEEWVTRMMEHAFSDRTTKRLRARPSFVARMRSIEARTEAHLYRGLQRQALDDLRRDLDAVWAERRMHADEAARRHARRLDLLYNLSWQLKRVQRRRGIAVAILSAMVELAVLRPLIARQKHLAVAERQAITAASLRVSDELIRLRQEWRDYAAEQGARTSGFGDHGIANSRPLTPQGSRASGSVQKETRQSSSHERGE